MPLTFLLLYYFTSVAHSFGSLLVIFCCIYYFYEFLHYLQPVNLKQESSFWICLGLLFYHCVTLPWFGIMTFYFAVSQRVVKTLFILLNVGNIVLYTFFIIAFLCRLKTPKYTSR